MAETVKQKARREKRIKRKKGLAESQAIQFEDTLSGHELNLARLNAMPETLRDAEWGDAIANEKNAIAQLGYYFTQILR